MVELDRWLVGHVLNPAHALFGETDYLLREDSTITDRALYQSVLAAIAGGQITPGGIAASPGRDARSLWTCCGQVVSSADPRMSSPGGGRSTR
jgi:hypothetical protein